ncbi:MAG: hypothetical protein AB1610_02425 [Nitrospirota bacterium]
MKRLLKKLKDITVSITFTKPEEYDSTKGGSKSSIESAANSYREKRLKQKGRKGVKHSTKKMRGGHKYNIDKKGKGIE